MTGERKVNAVPLCSRELELFQNTFNAWEHFTVHVLNAARGEPWGWAVLIPALQALLDAGRRTDLHDEARQASPERVPKELQGIWSAFLEQIITSVERGVSLAWYYEDKAESDEGPYKVFAPSGILAYLDDERVRTGFLPSKEEVPSGLREIERRYRLFLACWEKVQRKFDRAVRQGGIRIKASDDFQKLMKTAPTQAAWESLKQ